MAATTGNTVNNKKKKKSPEEKAAKKAAREAKAAAREKAVLLRRAERSAKAQKERETWESHSTKSKGLIIPKRDLLARLGNMRLRHRCTWKLKAIPFGESVSALNEPVPVVMLTDPKGRRFFLEDDKTYTN